jgi:hypothetical protein
MKRFPKRYLLSYLFCLPADIVCWLIVIAIRLRFLKGGYMFWQHGLWCEIPKDNWAGMAGGIIGHGGWYRRGAIGKGKEVDTEVEFHEHFHVEQFEVNMLRVFMISLAMAITLAIAGLATTRLIYFPIILWSVFGFLSWVVPGWIQAWIRGESIYKGSIHEEGAYAAAEKYIREKTGIRR